LASIRGVLEEVRRKKISVEEAEKKLKLLTLKNVENFARLDIGRSLRKKVPEIVYAENKTPIETVKIVEEMVKNVGEAIVSRVKKEHVKELKKRFEKNFEVKVYDKAKIVVVSKRGFKVEKTGGKIGVLTAGTADVHVAEEAVVVAERMGCKVLKAYDVGVAGLHRLFQPLKKMVREGVDVFVVVAGMEGALPSVVTSLVDCPVIGVPVSTGYGYGGGGETALMAMLQSCSLGLAVVNIDNGVGAGVLAALIANRIAEARKNRKHNIRYKSVL